MKARLKDSNWRELGKRPDASPSRRAIAAALAVILGQDREAALLEFGNGKDSLDSGFSHARLIWKHSPISAQKCFDGELSIYGVQRDIRYKLRHGKSVTEPDAPPVDRFKKPIALDIAYEFFSLLSLESLGKARKHELSLHHPDRGHDGDKARRLNELFDLIKTNRGE